MPLFRPKNPLPPAFFDPDLSDSGLAALRHAAAGRDWAAVKTFFDQNLDPGDHAFYVNEFSGCPGTEQWLYDVAQCENQTTLAPLLLAARRIVVAWSLRSAYSAAYVNQAQFDAFHAELRVAEQMLIEITAHEPDNATAWCLRLKTARGLQLGQEEARRRYQQVALHSPHNLTAQHLYLQQICPKWGGTFEKLHAFAQEAYLKAPAGAMQGELVAWAHLEQGGYLGTYRRLAYFKQPHVRADLKAAAERSVLHPEFHRRPGWTQVHNSFALALSLARRNLSRFFRHGLVTLSVAVVAG